MEYNMEYGSHAREGGSTTAAAVILPQYEQFRIVAILLQQCGCVQCGCATVARRVAGHVTSKPANIVIVRAIVSSCGPTKSVEKAREVIVPLMQNGKSSHLYG